MVLDAVGQGQRVAHSGFHGPSSTSAATLLVGHAHCAAEHGPGIPVRRVEQVKHLPREVQRPALVEVFRVVLADVSLAFPLPRRYNLVVRLRCGCEVIGAVDPLLVEIHMHLRHPRLVKGGARLGLTLGLPGQIAVHVEQVVVGTPARPRFVVLPSVRVSIGSRGSGLVLEMHVPVAAVRIDTRVHHHDSPLEQVAVGRRQGHGCRHGGFGTYRFVAVHVVGQVHPHNTVPGIHPFHDPSLVGLTQGVKVGHVVFRGHDEPQQRPPFGRRTVFLELPMGSCFRQMFHDIHHLMVPCEFVSKVVTQHFVHIHICRRRLSLYGHPNEAQQQGRHPSAHFHGCNIAPECACRTQIEGVPHRDVDKSDDFSAGSMPSKWGF